MDNNSSAGVLVEDSDFMTEKRTPLSKRLGPYYPWLVVLLGAVFYCYEYYLRITPSVMTEELMRAFSISALALGNLAAFYYYAYTPMQLFVGVLLDRYGPRRMLVLACASCALGAYLFTSMNIHVAEMGRFAIGFGSAFAFVGALKLATIWLPPERFGLVSGLALMLGMGGAIFGDVTMTYLVECVGWRHTIVSTGLFGIALTLILWALVRDNDGSSELIEDTQQHNIIDGIKGLLHLFQNRNMWLNGAIGCLLYFSLTLFAEMWAPKYLEYSYSLTHTKAAWATSCIFFGWAMGGPIVGYLSDYLRLRRTITIFGSLLAAIVTAVILYIPLHSHIVVFTLLFFSGLFCSTQVLVFPMAREFSPNNLAGTALALTNMFVMIGGICQPLVGEILDLTWDGTMSNGLPVYSVHDFKVALSVLPVSFLCASIIAYCLPETRCKPHIT